MPSPQLNGSKPRYRVGAPTNTHPQTSVYQVPRQIQGELAVADPMNFAVGVGRGFLAWNPSQLVSRKGMRVFDDMLRDDQVKAALLLKKHAVVATGWTVQDPEDAPEDWEVTRFVKSEFDGLTGTVEQNLLPILSALDYGYSVTELVFEDRTEGEFAGKVGLKDLKTKKPHFIDIETDQFGNILPDGIIQHTPDGPKRLPREKFIVLSYQDDFGNPYGVSDLEAAYRPWWTKENAYTWLAMLLERFGIPPIFALYNAEKYSGALVDNLKTVISTIQANTSGVIPRDSSDDLEMWSPELGGQVTSVFIPAMERFDRDIARAILMPGLLGLGSDGEQGSLARARVQFDVFLLVIEFIRNVLSETVINEQLVRPLVDLNFNVESYPVWKLNPITDNTRLDILESWSQMVTAGVVQTTAEDEVHIRQQLEFPERDVEDIEADMEPPEPVDEEGDDEGEDTPGQEEDGRPFVHKHSIAEKAVNFQRIERTLDGLEASIVGEGVEILKAERDRLLRRLKAVKELRSDFPTRIKAGKLEPIMRRELERAVRSGRKEVKSEVGPRTFGDEPNNFLADALNWIRSLVGLSVKGVDDDLNKQAQMAILRAVEFGEGIQGAMNRIRDVFEPFIGDPAKVRDGEVVSPRRLETIARTNMTSAFNKGRLTQMRELDDLIDEVEFSAILDTRTTEICQHMDGRIFKINSPNLDRFSPPLHFQCRSVLIPLTPDIDPEDIPERHEDGTPSRIDDAPQVLAKTRRLVPEGFGGDPA